MNTKTEILSALKRLDPEARARYKVRSMALFGSFARGDNTSTSDVDLLVEFTDDADLFDLVALSGFLESILHRKVDVVPRRALRPELSDAVLRDLAPV